MATDGIDISATNDLDPAFRTVRGNTALGQALYRRLITPTGGLLFDETYGLGIQAFINASTAADSKALTRLAVACEAECRLDERVADVEARANVENGAIVIELRVQPLEGTSFDLTAAITDVSASLLSIS
jgi:hypothetical protein